MEVGSAAAAMPDFDLHQWFRPEELEPCSACGARAGIRLANTGSFLCLECGHVGAKLLTFRVSKRERTKHKGLIWALTPNPLLGHAARYERDCGPRPRL